MEDLQAEAEVVEEVEVDAVAVEEVEVDVVVVGVCILTSSNVIV